MYSNSHTPLVFGPFLWVAVALVTTVGYIVRNRGIHNPCPSCHAALLCMSTQNVKIKYDVTGITIPGNDDEIRKATSTGRPLGDVSFIDKLEELSGRLLKPQKRGRPRRKE